MKPLFCYFLYGYLISALNTPFCLLQCLLKCFLNVLWNQQKIVLLEKWNTLLKCFSQVVLRLSPPHFHPNTFYSKKEYILLFWKYRHASQECVSKNIALRTIHTSCNSKLEIILLMFLTLSQCKEELSERKYRCFCLQGLLLYK